MGKRMKRLTTLLLVLVLALQCLPLTAGAASQAPSRTINVVYDDSGSMIKTGGQLVDTWCQAKYAMEVFAAMLGEQDTMNIYVMSDFRSSTWLDTSTNTLSARLTPSASCSAS